MARASSGSRSSIRSIEPLMSANSAVTVLRSPSNAAAGWSVVISLVDAGRVVLLTDRGDEAAPGDELKERHTARKARCRRILKTALRAALLEWSGALLAELQSFRIFRPALRAAHPEYPSCRQTPTNGRDVVRCAGLGESRLDGPSFYGSPDAKIRATELRKTMKSAAEEISRHPFDAGGREASVRE